MMHNAVYDPNAAGCMSVGLFHTEKQTDRAEYSAVFSRREMSCKTVPSAEGEQGLWSFKKRA